MPLYLYRCSDCGEEDEILQKFSDPPATECESCKGRLERVITPTAFHLKGGGWYKDLYASAKPSEGGKSDSKSDAGSKGSSDASSKGSGTKAAAE